jgi:glycosyltransferase involved in cell wall biosynthesis
MLGRNKNNYEHGFALGASVERSSLIRISNWDPKFLQHNPEKPPQPLLDKPYILLVGRLDWDKMIDDIIACFNQVSTDYSDLHLVFVGDGPLYESLKEKAQQSPFADRIILTGYQSNEQTYQWTAHATIAWMPFAGATLTEALLCQVPVLAYDVEWQSELIIHNYTGWLCRFRDLKDLTKKIQWILENPKEAHAIAITGRAVALKAFDLDSLRAQENAIYQLALSSKKIGAGGLKNFSLQPL